MTVIRWRISGGLRECATPITFISIRRDRLNEVNACLRVLWSLRFAAPRLKRSVLPDAIDWPGCMASLSFLARERVVG